VFDTQFLVQCVHLGFRLGDVPVPVRYFEQTSNINFRRSVRYGVATLGVLVKYWRQRLHLARLPLFDGAAASSRWLVGASEPAQESTHHAKPRAAVALERADDQRWFPFRMARAVLSALRPRRDGHDDLKGGNRARGSRA
jgi:hypothetical protein